MARWLAGVEMGLAIGVALSLNELTMYFAQWMLPLAASDYGVGQSLVLGNFYFILFCLVLFCFVCFILLLLF